MDQNPGALAHLPDGSKKRLPITVIVHDRFAPIATSQHMVQRTRVLNPTLPSHVETLIYTPQNNKIKCLTPFSQNSKIKCLTPFSFSL
jgi:hypothetical protein